jgi:hypothetical protein
MKELAYAYLIGDVEKLSSLPPEVLFHYYLIFS